MLDHFSYGTFVLNQFLNSAEPIRGFPPILKKKQHNHSPIISTDLFVCTNVQSIWMRNSRPTTNLMYIYSKQ